ncbi:MAG TPA: hypothetical protein VFA65_21810 [Bryobacteraceae bacterium]|nr:hypothetical protein [Bryobacteraceae bacterium]
MLFLTAAASRADVYYITFHDVTFSATCVGGGATCTEVVNGSVFYDEVAQTTSSLSIQMSGTLNASLNSFGNPVCGNPVLCLNPPIL